MNPLFERFFGVVAITVFIASPTFGQTKNGQKEQDFPLLRIPLAKSYPTLEEALFSGVYRNLPTLRHDTWEQVERLKRWVDWGEEDLDEYEWIRNHPPYKTQAEYKEWCRQVDERAKIGLQKLRELVGPELWRATVARYNADAIAINAFRSGLPFKLDSTVMRKILTLTDDQRERHEKNTKKYLKQVSEWKKERDRRLGELAGDKYRELTKVLTSDQRKEYRELYGEPIWFYKLESDGLDMDRFRSWVNPHSWTTSGPIGTPAEKESADDQPPIPDQIDILWYYLISDPGLQTEFEATNDQVKQLKALTQRIRPIAQLTNRFHAQRLVQLLDGKFDDYGLLKGILLDHQLVWLRHCELQLRLVNERSSFGLLSPELAYLLHLTGDQKKQIREIVAQYETKSNELIAEMGEEYRTFSAEFIRENLAILNDEQKAALSRYVSPEDLAKIFIESLRPPLPREQKRKIQAGGGGSGGNLGFGSG